MLGEFSLDDISFIEKIVFMFGSLFATLTLLNLVVSLMGDHYSRVMTALEEENYK